MIRYGCPRLFSFVVSEMGRSHGSSVVGCGRVCREVMKAVGSEIWVARHWRRGEASA